MNRTLLVAAVLLVVACGSRVEFFPTSVTAARESDGKVLVTASMGLSTFGVSGADLERVTELCMTATWSEPAPVDAGSGDAGTSDAGISDAGVTDAGVVVADGGVILLPSTALGTQLSKVTQCQPGISGRYELRSADVIPTRKVIVTVTPFESDASRQKRSDGVPPVAFDGVQFVSP
ncbi:MAG: hypothetical protein U0228_06540 [Myxococcaceae bacterium]